MLFISREDLDRFGLADGETVNLRAASPDSVERRVEGYRLACRQVHPGGDAFGYFAELTLLASFELAALGSHTPAFKETPVLIEPCR